MENLQQDHQEDLQGLLEDLLENLQRDHQEDLRGLLDDLLKNLQRDHQEDLSGLLDLEDLKKGRQEGQPDLLDDIAPGHLVDTPEAVSYTHLTLPTNREV